MQISNFNKDVIFRNIRKVKRVVTMIYFFYNYLKEERQRKKCEFGFVHYLLKLKMPYLGCFVYRLVRLYCLFQNYACLPARTTTDRPMCKLQSDCHNPNLETSCVYPSIDNQTKLLRVIHGHKPPLLFLGHPLDLHYAGINLYFELLLSIIWCMHRSFSFFFLFSHYFKEKSN